MNLNRILTLATIMMFLSCEKEKQSETSTQFHAVSGSIYISNEGNFQGSNSTISYYNPESGEINANVFTNANDRPLGDICQSMNIIDNILYVVVNNSGKIEACNPLTMESYKTIQGFISPRYIIQAGISKAYISDAYSNFISILDLNSNNIIGTIPFTGWSEQMLEWNGKIIVTNTASDYLYFIDTSNDQISDSILISKGANSVLMDKNGKVWVLCGGDYLQSYTAALYRLDPATKQVEMNTPFNISDFPSRLCKNNSEDTLYFLNNGVFKMSIDEVALPGSPFIASNGNNFYGLGIDKLRNNIYVSDAVDFIQRGKVYRYRADGTEISNITAGIIPGDFLVIP